jgi:NAD+ kinase
MKNKFKKIGIIGKLTDPVVAKTMSDLAEHLTDRGIDVLIDQKTADRLLPKTKYPTADRNTLAANVDLCAIVGGDGTLLNAARSLSAFEVPLLGFNLGRLGFLTDLLPTDMADKLDEILSGDFTEEPRGLLHVSIYRNDKQIDENCAFNDVVLHKWKGARMLEYETYIDKRFINTTRSDGLIVSTPTGSTGYALSGGGPIIHPELHAIVLVPICPHTMTYRPIVVYAESKIKIILKNTNDSLAQITCDGQINMDVCVGDIVRIKKHDHLVTLIHPKNYDYFSILRKKLHWGKRL